MDVEVANRLWCVDVTTARRYSMQAARMLAVITRIRWKQSVDRSGASSRCQQRVGAGGLRKLEALRHHVHIWESFIIVASKDSHFLFQLGINS